MRLRWAQSESTNDVASFPGPHIAFHRMYSMRAWWFSYIREDRGRVLQPTHAHALVYMCTKLSARTLMISAHTLDVLSQFGSLQTICS